MLIAGIDYSMTCPCVCISTAGKTFTFNTCEVHYLTQTNKYSGNFKNIHGSLFEVPTDPYKRYDGISSWAYNLVKNCDCIILEDYSMGSKGKVFHIAENTAFLKYKLYTNNKKFITLAPTSLKKYATGKGNSDKNIMYSFYEKEKNNIDLKKLFNIKGEKITSPISDIVDSFYLLKYLNNNLESINV